MLHLGLVNIYQTLDAAALRDLNRGKTSVVGSGLLEFQELYSPRSQAGAAESNTYCTYDLVKFNFGCSRIGWWKDCGRSELFTADRRGTVGVIGACCGIGGCHRW